MRYAFLAMCICLLMPCHAMSQEIVLAADFWCPVNCDPDSERPGYAVEIAKEIFTPLGYTVRYDLMPWTRAVVAVENGQATAIIGALRGETDVLFPEEPIGHLANSFYVRRDDPWEYSGPISLKSKLLGTIQNYGYGEIQEFIDNGFLATHTATGNQALVSLMHMLENHRIDVVVEWAPVFAYFADANGFGQRLRHAGTTERADPMYIAFGWEYGELAAIWDKGIRELREKGRLWEILQHYDLTPADCGLDIDQDTDG